jgi:amidase
MLIPSDPVHAFVDYPDVPVPNAPDGSLAGVTFAVKDIFDVAGYPSGWGNPIIQAASAPAKTSAPPVAMLLAAGARFVGKTQTAELAFSLDGRNDHYGTPINSAAPGRVPGGSSSGSASAVAAGLVDVAIGSDTGGSVRGPASFCGIIGLRPTHGRIDLAGAMPLAPSLDTVGWFTRDIGLFERVGAVLLGEDEAGPPLKRMVIAGDAFAGLAAKAEEEALRPAVARVAKHLDPPQAVTVSAEGLEVWQKAFRMTQGFEAWQAHGPWVEQHWADLNQPVRPRFELARKVTEADYREAAEMRARVRQRMNELLGDDGVIVLPTMPTIAVRLDAKETEFESFRSLALSALCMAGLAGVPQISLPMATVSGCPLGLSLIGPPARDRSLIALARAVLQN